MNAFLLCIEKYLVTTLSISIMKYDLPLIDYLCYEDNLPREIIATNIHLIIVHPNRIIDIERIGRLLSRKPLAVRDLRDSC